MKNFILALVALVTVAAILMLESVQTKRCDNAIEKLDYNAIAQTCATSGIDGVRTAVKIEQEKMK